MNVHPGSELDFKVEGQTAFEVPLNYVSHSTTAKNEVTLEFHQNDDAPLALMELRFHIPTDASNEKDEVEVRKPTHVTRVLSLYVKQAGAKSLK